MAVTSMELEVPIKRLLLLLEMARQAMPEKAKYISIEVWQQLIHRMT